MKKLLSIIILVTILAVGAGAMLLTGQASENNISPEGRSASGGGRPLAGKTIVLDPGHGGRDGGTTGLTHGTNEKELNLKVANNIREELQQRTGANVLLTREDDNSLLGGTDQKAELQARIDFAKSNKADLYISIHHDAFEDRNVEGITTHYAPSKSSSHVTLAKSIQKGIFEQNVDTRDRGVKASDYMVLRESSIPAVLLELGFTSNEKDERRMNSAEFQDKSKKGIVDGILDYFGAK
ncbi:N-acetylmuramoyl-L-alanine amidase family protein [Priestia taiwanensis]|uniref:MurNAc-LAA domain-containing protein n=1 Tax=Priestia taiwanensis TaxID=1347902 RepID=A0A917ARW7_9BACI|nr:N-acetylmuramoyl-L-alanine amidase [Priestia taiwanensis]MBM7363878.1 N-acetylmuramoyl-L-alanine amidase [Priestia taiwanensis]GGE69744.1 hypothetical protein GCM10007140_19710 [Priestia taiwanensis]